MSKYVPYKVADMTVSTVAGKVESATEIMRIELPDIEIVIGGHVDMSKEAINKAIARLDKTIAELECKKIQMKALAEELTDDQLIQAHSTRMVVHDRELFYRKYNLSGGFRISPERYKIKAGSEGRR